MFKRGQVISYLDMCKAEGVNLQRGMNYRLGREYSVILMSLRPSAPYADRVEDDGKVLIYEGHDAPRRPTTPNPKLVDQPTRNPGGNPTQNQLFFNAAERYKLGNNQTELVKVYEKVRSGIWVYNGFFKLVDAWKEKTEGRTVFKFRLILVADEKPGIHKQFGTDIEHDRLIPSAVKREVWQRDKGRCVTCGRQDNLHFDHIIPYSKGGSSLVARNIQLLCARHNIAKKDRIE